MHVLRRSSSFVGLLPLLFAPACAQDSPQKSTPGQPPSDFVRFVKEGDGGHLDTAITTYQKGDVQLRLFAAVHIADAACYANLNDRFTTCDALLYELVGPADYRPTKDREEHGFNPVSLLQKSLKNSLELTFQLDEIDYTAANFVHADMTPEEFSASMAERGESLLSIMWNMMMSGMQSQQQKVEAQDGESGKAVPVPGIDLVTAFRTGEGRHTMRMAFAGQLEEMEILAVGGPGSTLLEGRNEKCLQVLTRELAAGKRQLGIYYGAAHLAAMERRLIDDFGFQKAGQEWIVAWDCKKRPDVKYDRELVLRRRRSKDELQAIAAAMAKYRAAMPVTLGQMGELVQTGKLDEKLASKDPWGHAYVVRQRPRGTRWEVLSLGQDGLLGSDDDLVVQQPRGS